MPKKKGTKGSKRSKRSNKSNNSRKSNAGQKGGRRSVKFKRAGGRNSRGVGESRGMGLSPVTAPAVQAFVSGWREPKFKHRSTGGFRVEHIEYVDDLAGYTTYGEAGSVVQKSINPGNAGLLPWLASIAADFEQYTFHRLSAYYLPAGVATDTPGSIVLAPDYDPNDKVVFTSTGPTVSQAELLNFQDRQLGPPWAALACHFDKNAMFPTGPRKYVNTSTYSGEDARLTDAALLITAAYQAPSDAKVFGKLFLHYDVECFVPARDTGAVGDTIASTQFNGAIATPLPTTLTVLLGSAGGISTTGNSGVTMDVLGQITAAPGWWLVETEVVIDKGGASYPIRAHLSLSHVGVTVTGSTRTFEQSIVDDAVTTLELATSSLVHIGEPSEKIWVAVEGVLAGGTTIGAVPAEKWMIRFTKL